jgi:hypothetical protein
LPTPSHRIEIGIQAEDWVERRISRRGSTHGQAERDRHRNCQQKSGADAHQGRGDVLPQTAVGCQLERSCDHLQRGRKNRAASYSHYAPPAPEQKTDQADGQKNSLGF